ncbi:MAG: DUF4157 domain-containing protein, partial [Cyanothece sp. SIO2G6]|nr:DUF4157 domain-containing protein [Cyanothece sp. SIO2G6]
MSTSSRNHQPTSQTPPWTPPINRLPSRPFSDTHSQTANAAPRSLHSRPFSDPSTQSAANPDIQTQPDPAQRQRLSALFDLTKADFFAGAQKLLTPPPMGVMHRQPSVNQAETEADIEAEANEGVEESLQRQCADCAAEDGDGDEDRLNAPNPASEMADGIGAIAQPQPIQAQSVQTKSWVQRQGTGELPAPSGVEKAIANTQGRGAPLADDVRQPMEQAFGGVDFSGVRIHTDQQSNHLNQVVQAKAFTTKQDIYFRNGAYDPGSQRGQTLLAHELTHVVQQTGIVQKANNPSPPSYSPSQPPEISALEGNPPTVGTPTERLAQPQIQRWVLPTDWLDYLGLAISVGERVYIKWPTRKE